RIFIDIASFEPPNRSGPLIELGVFPRRTGPGKVRAHPLPLQSAPPWGVSVHLKRAFERMPQSARMIVVEEDSGALRFGRVPNRVREAAGAARYRHGAITHGDHLSQPARLVPGGDQECVGASVDSAGVGGVKP